MLSVSWDRQLKVQDESPPEEGRLIKALHAGHCCDVTTAAYSHAHLLLATGGDDGGVQVWRLDERGVPHPHYELVGHTGPVRHAEFSLGPARRLSLKTAGSFMLLDDEEAEAEIDDLRDTLETLAEERRVARA